MLATRFSAYVRSGPLTLTLALGAFGLACSADPISTSRITASGGSGSGATVPGVGSTPSTTPSIAQVPGAVTTPVVTPMQPVAPPVVAVTAVHVDTCVAGQAGLTDHDLQQLVAGGPTTGMRFLYPYDDTVFPRGLSAPLLMWEGGAATLVLLHVTGKDFDYRICLKPDAAGQLHMPQDLWDMAGVRTPGPSAPFTLELTALNNGAAAGPLTRHFVIAQATIKGSIFYNSYNSHLITSGQPGGAVLRIPAGGKAELFVSKDCNGCHSVSANGSRLISQAARTGGQSFQLTPMSTPEPPAMSAGPNASFGALDPTGSVYLATSTVVEVARAAMVASGRGGAMSSAATLYETDTGTAITGTNIPDGALMPTFSPSGKLLVFNDNAISSAHGLALMDFDLMTRKASQRRVLFTDTQLRPAWPFLLPDDHAVVFTRTDSSDFSGQGAGLMADMNDPFGALFGPGGAGTKSGGKGPVSDLYIVDIKTGTATILARTMGYASPADATSGMTYLPFGSEELHQSYFPTVSPVGAGGYFWIFFDAVRHYGNQGAQRQLWGAAIDIAADGDYTLDRSHPAFYLPGQEFGTGNHRAFAALDPCKQDGASCTSGVDCCGGFCSIPDVAAELGIIPTGTCSSKRPMCAKTGERCTIDGDCCPPSAGERQNTCIAGFCTLANVLQ